MGESKLELKVRSSPAKLIGQATEELARPLLLILTIFVFPNRAMSRGGMKSNFINNGKKTFKAPLPLKMHE